MRNRIISLDKLLIAAIVIAVSVSNFAPAATARDWIGPNGFGSNGNWNTVGNWSPAGVPGSGDDANILLNNGTSAAINYDYTGPAVTIGNLDISASPFPRRNPTATLNIAANSLSAVYEFVGNSGTGSGGVGAINQSGGTNHLKSGLELAVNATDNGAYTLSSGTLEIFDSAHNPGVEEESVGYLGTATFNQNGGLNTTGALMIGAFAGANGAYTLSGGNLLASLGTLGRTGVIVGGHFAGDPASAMPGGTGVLTVSGTGQLSADNVYVLNTSGSSLNLTGGAINTRTLFVAAPSAFNWTSGDLNFTDGVTLEPFSTASFSCVAFGSALNLDTGRSMETDRDEGIGGLFGSFKLTVGAGGANGVTGTLTVNPSGTLELEGGTVTVVINAVNHGLITINSGSFSVGGPKPLIESFSTLQLNGGKLEALGAEGHIDFYSTNTLQMNLGGAARGSQYGWISCEDLALSGSLVVSLNNFAPSAGQSFDILDWGSLAGTFSTLQLPALAGGLVWDTSQLYVTGVLSVRLPGDYNQNGVVDAADYVVWRKGLGTTYTQTDYDVWRAHFGQTAGSGAGALANAAVPEPVVSMQIILVSVVLSLRSLRRRRGA